MHVHLTTDEGGFLEELVVPGTGLTLGRHRADRSFPGDEWLSSPHVQLRPTPGGMEVRDLNALNGVWVEVTGDGEHLSIGDELLVGSARFRLDPVAVLPRWAPPLVAPALCHGSKRPPAVAVLTELLAGGEVGTRTLIDEAQLYIGTAMSRVPLGERDPFADSGHAVLETTAKGPKVADLGSRTGTYRRMRGSAEDLPHGSRFRIGHVWLQVV